MTTLALIDTDPAELPVDAIVIGVYSQAGDAAAKLLVASGGEPVVAAFDGKLVETLYLLGANGSAGEVTKLATLGTLRAPLVVAVGLGAEPTGAAPAHDTLRKAAASAVRALAGATSVAVVLPLGDGAEGAGLAALRAVAEGARLGTYRFAGYKSTPPAGRRDVVAELSIHVPDAADPSAQVEVTRAEVVTRAVAQTRDWINTAPNLLRPPAFADAVAASAAGTGLTIEILDEQQLRDGGYGGIVAVGQGSEAPPRLVKLAYTPASTDAAAKKIALIGKGITFDTGGISIKPAQGMWEMKSDMSGAAAVAATMIAVAALRPAVSVTAYIPMAENMPSGHAYRPGDVITMYGGKKVEVLNTDAEGRMILGDAIARASEDHPDYLFETSTLTGGQVVALGKRVSGVMGTASLGERVREAGDRVGEAAWPMPLPDEIRKAMESDVADITQVANGMDRAGHMLQGGIFLREFVGEGIDWAHIDIAGPAYHSGEAAGYTAKGGTGVPVRMLIDLIEDIAANG